MLNRNYEILRDREISKGGQSGELIRNYRADIDRIHYDAGYLLQVRAESSGRASAFFQPAEFEEVVRRQLSRSLVEPDEISRVTSQIVEIATTRLVFLGARNEDQITFDVRSLQEFMAAARIMVSPESLISRRLKEIAVKTHWQNVFKIACSKVYALAALEDYRDEICRIIDRLDLGDEGMEYRVIRAGAKLAIALLTDSTAGSRPVERQALITRALRILEIRVWFNFWIANKTEIGPRACSILEYHVEEGKEKIVCKTGLSQLIAACSGSDQMIRKLRDLQYLA